MPPFIGLLDALTIPIPRYAAFLILLVFIVQAVMLARLAILLRRVMRRSKKGFDVWSRQRSMLLIALRIVISKLEDRLIPGETVEKSVVSEIKQNVTDMIDDIRGTL